METLAIIMISTVIAITRMLLDRQREDDHRNGINAPNSEYTILGVLKLMRREVKEKRRLKKNARA